MNDSDDISPDLHATQRKVAAAVRLGVPLRQVARPGVLVSARASGPCQLIEETEQVYLLDNVGSEDVLCLLHPCPVRHVEGWWVALWIGRGLRVRIKANDWLPIDPTNDTP